MNCRARRYCIEVFVLVGVISYLLVFVVAAEDDQESIRSSRQANKCSIGQFTCSSGKCIGEELLCDGKGDCQGDNSDETSELCENNGCLKIFYRCQYGACVSHTARCNGIAECVDNSDEESCFEPVVTEKVTLPPAIIESGGCLLPNNPVNGKFSIVGGTTDAYKNGTRVAPYTVITLTCKSGTRLFPDNSFSLCVDGVWTQPPSECMTICPTITDSESLEVKCTRNGQNSPCTNPVENTVAILSCKPKYEDLELQKNPVRFCYNGNWNGVIRQCSPVCGLVQGNDVTAPYPWHVFVYNENKSYLCGGTIISERIVVTAAHCVGSVHGDTLDPSKDFFVAANKRFRDYNDSRDENAQYSLVKSIHIPAQYRGRLNNFQADIAVAILANKLVFTGPVGPACVDWDSSKTDDSIGKTATIYGFAGKPNTTDLPDNLQNLNFNLLPFGQCFEKVPSSFKVYLTVDKVCGSLADDNQAICAGSSGAGLMLMKNGRFYLHAVTSVFPLGTSVCTIGTTGSFTLMSSYINFVKKYAMTSS